ncbi:coiled-coil domain-containing protein 77 [Poecilia formosa]|uniref:Coiled-coil domain containing 77 n=1 Tax=Poecilia formosa TaxID=48698 RepID=A0A087Y4B4_POEFO|nr:PREDICTED: coiled-coil domain-containing protein 77 [Poecilia formosa]XP_007561452.1 PREDICTED: coiled-coil domain-containing protein 77 [Poecilia formosa]XP_016531547.1 PREDICTED: coiled-coil domain-containing protein 77 [Poecilia formosa]
MGSPAKHGTPHRVSIHSPSKDLDSPLPPIEERLAYLRPSRELLQFYRQKIAQYDGEHEELLQMLEKFKSIAEDQHKLQYDIQEREREVTQLQNALSDMQVYLFQEREQSLRLYAENDRLKIRELEDRKKIQHLLALVGPDAGEITYFHQEPPHKVAITQRQPESMFDDNLSLRPTKLRPAAATKEANRKTKSAGDGVEKYKNDNQTLLLQVEALQAQMEEQTRLVREQVEALLEDRRIITEESQAQRQRDHQRITALSEKLQQTQNLLHESTRDFLKQKFDARANEKSWIVEKDRLLRELDSCHHRLMRAKARFDGAELTRSWQPSSSRSVLFLPQPQPELSDQHKEEKKALQDDLKQAHKLAEMFREQCITLETELSQIREEGDVGREIFKERSDKMAKRLQLMTQRYEALEKRRVMEVEGFKADLKLLRQKLKDVEKQLLKVTLNIGPNQDLAILHEVRQTNSRTKKVQNELMALKAKIYGLENELRIS